MARTKIVDGVVVPLTPEEEAARDAEEAYYASAQYITDKENRVKAGAEQKLNISGMDKAQFEALLDHENRIRALESRPSVTRQQLIDWVKERVV